MCNSTEEHELHSKMAQPIKFVLVRAYMISDSYHLLFFSVRYGLNGFLHIKRLLALAGAARKPGARGSD